MNKKLLQIDFSILTGKSLRQAKKIAKKHNMILRINSEDGVVFIKTHDYKNNRLNIELTEGIVSKYNGIG